MHEFPGLGRERMPPLDEGSLLYMPSLLPSASLTEAQKVIAQQDVAMLTVPEVVSVVGKFGRAESALDPAPIGMIETIVLLKPRHQWRRVPQEQWHSGVAWLDWARPGLAYLWPEERPITKKELLRDLDEKVAILTDNAVADSRFKGQSIVLQSVRSAMCSPLLDSKDEAVGLLYVDNMTATNSFSDEDLQFLVAFSNLENALKAEYTELGNAILGLSQAYAISAESSCKAFRGGSNVTDTPQTVRFFIVTVAPTSIDVNACTGSP